METRKSTKHRYKNSALLKRLGRHCRKLRIKKGYSIDRMALEGDQMGKASIQRLETGEGDVQISLLFRYAEVLGIEPKELLNFE